MSNLNKISGISFIFASTFLAANILFAANHQKPLLAGKSNGMPYRVELVTSGLGVTWGMSFLSKTQLIFTQRSGKVGILNLKTNQKTLLSGTPKVFASGQGGMLDVALFPDYLRANLSQPSHPNQPKQTSQTSDWIYFTYSKPADASLNEAATTLARARLNLAKHQLTNWQDLLITQSRSDSGQHFGSRIAFDGAGHVFFGIGDRGYRPNGQDLKTHSGSILRLHLDGKTPRDNPFVNDTNALPEIWSYGHRNPQGIVYDHQKKQLWEIEHGPRGGDEINIIQRGKNYGWPIISHGKEYWGPLAVGEGTSKAGMEQPVKVYIPSIAPGSLLLYTGNAFPKWRGNLFTGALKLRHLNRVVLKHRGKVVEEEQEERLLKSLNERIRSLAQSPEGWIYLGTDSGKILRIVPNTQ